MSFLVKSVSHDKPLRIHEANAEGRPVCSGVTPRFKQIRHWQTDPGPANCKLCKRISHKQSMTKIESISIRVFGDKTGKFKLSIQINDIPQRHERIERDYETPSDAITSARHTVKELTK